MIAEYLNRRQILHELRAVQASLAADIDEKGRAGAAAPEDEVALHEALTQAAERESQQSSGQEGFDAPESDRRGNEPAPLDDYAFFSRDPIVSLLQSALDEEAAVKHPEKSTKQAPRDDERRGPDDDFAVSDTHLVNAPSPVRDTGGRRVFDKFSVTDVLWVRSLLAEGVRLWRGKQPFNDVPAEPVILPERARLVVVGDWGSGLPRARKVADEMRKVIVEGDRQGLNQHVVHLGDVYYSGWSKEYERRFLPYWPVLAEEAGRIGSWAVNSNHDMYCGGEGYFKTLLADPRFERQRKSSWFSFVHPHWKILGLDTAWQEGVLHGSQTAWLEEQLRDKQRKPLLLSHHQLFSAYERNNKALDEQVGPIFERYPVKAWFWGHEHRCVLYRPTQNVQFGRCIGHGGVPVYMWHKEEDIYPPPAKYEYRAAFRKGLERWAWFGFAVLDFDGETLNVRYINENGDEHHRETLQ